MNRRNKISAGIGRQLGALTALLAISGTASAGLYNDGKVLLTSGAVTVDGSSGGGITPWATIIGNEVRDGINATLHYTFVYLPNYDVNFVGGGIGFFDRAEITWNQAILGTGSTYDTVGLVGATAGSALSSLGITSTGSGGAALSGIEPFNTSIRLMTVGAKVRLFGEAIYDSDNLIPQVAVGGYYKWNQNKDLLKTLGAAKADDYEAYIAVTKIFFPFSTLVNLTGRWSSANQTGLVGFGGPNGDKHSMRLEADFAYLLNKMTAIGGEYQMHSNHLGTINTNLGSVSTNSGLVGGLLNSLTGGELNQKESDWYDVFVAFEPTKNFAIVAAYAMLGNIVITPHQNGFYIELQAMF